MKAICTIGHEVPHGNGKFTRYEAGQEYEVTEIGKYFKAIEQPKRRVTAEINKEVKEDGIN